MITPVPLDERLHDLPEFSRIVDLVGNTNPLQRKRVRAMLATRDDTYFEFAEDLSRSLRAAFMRDQDEAADVASAYDDLCLEMLREQIRFRRTGTYRLDDAAQANETVYSDPIRMRRYLVGLLMTYLFWPNHYALFQLFRQGLSRLRPQRCLEVGAGHGLFTAELLRQFPAADVRVVDVSPASVEMTRQFLASFGVADDAVGFSIGDFMAPDLELAGNDLIVLGEVIEHVNDAGALLRRAAELLLPDASLFLTTCANCPAEDHIYYFGSAADIRALIADCGLEIVEEVALPAEDVPEEDWEAQRITVNYGAFLRRRRETGLSSR